MYPMSSIMPVPININISTHVSSVIYKLEAAGLLPMHTSPMPFLERLRGTNTEPLMIVRHPNPDNDSSIGVVREHRVDEAIALLADPNGPEALLRERRKREIAAQAESEANAKRAAAARASAERQQRWDVMGETHRALWLVAARLEARKNVRLYDDGPAHLSTVKRVVEETQRDLLAALGRAFVEAKSATAPEDLIHLPRFAA